MPMIQVGPNTWRMQRKETAPARSDLPCPMIISDTMEPTEHVNGKFYTSKAAYRAHTRAIGNEEIGTEKLPPFKRPKPDRKKRRETIQKAIARFKNGERVKI